MNDVTANLNYPRYTGTVRIEPFSGTSTPEVNQWGINGQAYVLYFFFFSKLNKFN